MAQITAALVKELRERTGAGMMDCKKALTAVEGDMDKAIDFLREKGLAAAAKKAGRIAAEGVVGSFVSADGKIGAIVEVNCETDFVAKTDGFKALVEKIAAHIVATKPADVEALLASELDGQTVEALVTASVAKIGEKISVRRFALYEAPEGVVAAYIHGGGKIGVIVELKGGNAELGKDVAMHVAAANPSYLERSQVPAAELEHEKEVLSEQAKNEGKPEKIIEKMVMGRINKYYKEVCLVDQEFVKDPDQTVGKLVKAAGAEVLAFSRFQLGEGIEKKQEDFAAEVMSQIK
ncbi:translation elongation factor Ts [Phascolarctobacterium succinatutens]|uniref:translation elongation factor Ts n=1 Tax=Phascolarctobacterium succinatutens TaxID=626940 RepID=UPI0027B916F5|nr:translation elongation factor Ts [Phascolarctobacterium succinatutens]